MGKILKNVFIIISALSVAINYAQFRSRNNNHINGTNFTYFGLYSVKTDGCLIWKDKKQQPTALTQYFKINISQYDAGPPMCSIIDASEWASGGIIMEHYHCEVVGWDKDHEIAIVKYKDTTITISKEFTVIATDNPEEKGIELGRCTDPRINWYL